MKRIEKEFLMLLAIGILGGSSGVYLFVQSSNNDWISKICITLLFLILLESYRNKLEQLKRKVNRELMKDTFRSIKMVKR